MPFLKSADFAAEKIFNGLVNKKKFEIFFPFFIVFCVKILRILPYKLYFYLWKKNKALAVNRYGMLEPVKNSIKIPNLMLIPILAYDKYNFRLGYGKGFYDRYLNKYLRKFKNIITVGVAFSFQKHHKLPKDKNDVKLNYILTEKGIY